MDCLSLSLFFLEWPSLKGKRDSEQKLIAAMNRGDRQAQGQAIELIQDRLRDHANKELSRWFKGATWEPDALVNQAYDRLISRANVCQWESLNHFRSLMERAIHEIMIERYRRESKPGGSRGAARRSARRRAFDERGYAEIASSEDYPGVLMLQDAIEKLRALHPVCAQIIDLRFGRGLTIAETAAEMEMSTVSIERKTAFAKAWLYKQLSDSDQDTDKSP